MNVRLLFMQVLWMLFAVTGAFTIAITILIRVFFRRKKAATEV